MMRLRRFVLRVYINTNGHTGDYLDLFDDNGLLITLILNGTFSRTGRRNRQQRYQTVEDGVIREITVERK